VSVSARERPPAIPIDDLSVPVFSADARAVLDMMSGAGAAIDLQPGTLMATAREETGLTDFGPDDFVERLDVLCRALRDEAGLNGAGVLAQSMFLTGLLRNRLLLEDLLRRHPEILNEPIEQPIFICGLPRTGTTHLHNLISSDTALRSLPYWESLEPVPLPSDAALGSEQDPRRARTDVALDFLNIAMPEFSRMHEMTVDHVHEEIQLLAIDVSTMLFETIAPMPSWRDHYLARDQRPSYRYLKKILQALQWLRGGTRWILKSPQHLEQFPALLDTFPDGTFVVTHRDPVSVTSSMVTMLAYTARLSYDRVDVPHIGLYWADRLQRMLRSCVAHRDVLPASRSMDVHFDEFMRDDIAMVRRIYDLAGQPFTGSAEASMRRFMDEHPRGRHGGVIYDLDQFDLDADQLRGMFNVYVDRFGVTEEPAP
jgi:hypothetical protein